MEREIKTIPGLIAILVNLLLLALALYFLSMNGYEALGIVIFVATLLMLRGYFSVLEQEARICTLFGKYHGTVKQAGFYWYNPFTQQKALSLRKRSGHSPLWTVHDQRGIPIQVSATIRWIIISPAAAFFKLEKKEAFIFSKAETILQHLITSYHYALKSETPSSQNQLPAQLSQFNAAFQRTLNTAIEPFGLLAEEARISRMEASPVFLEESQQAHLSKWLKSRHVLVEGGIRLTEKTLLSLENKSWKLNEAEKAQLLNTIIASVCQMPLQTKNTSPFPQKDTP